MKHRTKKTVTGYRNKGTAGDPQWVYEMSCGHDLPVFRIPEPGIIGKKRPCGVCQFEYRQSIWAGMTRQ